MRGSKCTQCRKSGTAGTGEMEGVEIWSGDFNPYFKNLGMIGGMIGGVL